MEVILPGLAKQLKPLRQSKGMTQKQMAELLGCTEQHYQKTEHGNAYVPATHLIFFAYFFGVSPDYLLGRDGADTQGGA